jgi:hypothetical protein
MFGDRYLAVLLRVSVYLQVMHAYIHSVGGPDCTCTDTLCTSFGPLRRGGQNTKTAIVPHRFDGSVYNLEDAFRYVLSRFSNSSRVTTFGIPASARVHLVFASHGSPARYVDVYCSQQFSHLILLQFKRRDLSLGP